MYWNTGADALSIYDGSSWSPYSPSGGAVASVFGRTGAVTAQSNDYSFSQLSGTIAASQISDTSITAAKVDNSTDTKKAEWRSSIYASPFDALSYNGLQANGGCEISQQFVTNATTANGYVVDQWIVAKNGTMVFSAQQLSLIHI